MAVKRVLIASKHPLFDAGIHALLAHDPNVEVVGVCRGDANELASQAQALQTDVILVFGQTDDIPGNMARLLDCATACLIAINLGGNTIQVYRRREVRECQFDDVMTAILAEC